MPKYQVRCIDRETGNEYIQTVEASTEANARTQVVNDGHMLVGGLDKAPPAPVRDAGSETVHLLRELLEEQRVTKSLLERKMLTQWRLIFALYAAVVLPAVLLFVLKVLSGPR